MRPGLSLRHRIRFALAPSRARRDLARNVGIIAIIMAAYAVVGTIEYHDSVLAERDAAQADARLQRAAMVACLNGGSPGLYTTDERGNKHYIVCSGELMIVSDENTGRRRM